MKTGLKMLLVAASMLSGQSIFAQAPALPIVEMLGGEYYSYTVEEGDSAYGIAKRFGWNYDELCRLNPQVVKNLKKGARLYYPTGNKTADAIAVIPDETKEPKVISHVVRKGDTVYSIAAKYGISTDMIYASHPSARQGIREGETINVSRGASTESGDRTPSPTRAEEAAAAESQTTSAAASEVRPAGSLPEIIADTATSSSSPVPASQTASSPQDTIPVDATVDIIEVAEGPSVDSSDIDRERVSNMAVVLDNPTLQRDREFMRGFLLALKDMENSGQKVRLTAIDATKGSESVVSTLSALSPDIIILTYDKNIPAWLIDYGNSSHTPLVNVFDVKYSATDSNPSVMQLLAPSKDFNEGIADMIAKEFGDGKLMFLNAPSASDGIASELEKRWNPAERVVVPFENLLDKRLGEDTRYLFYVNATSKDEIQKCLEEIGKLREQTPLASVKVIGRPSWVTHAAELGEQFAKYDVYIPSRFYFNWNDPKAQNFVSRYEEMYNRRPTLTYPVFSVAGYDVAECFIPSVAANGGDFSKGMLRGQTLQSNFILEKSGPSGGYINKGYYLVRFTPFGTIEKILAD